VSVCLLFFQIQILVFVKRLSEMEERTRETGEKTKGSYFVTVGREQEKQERKLETMEKAGREYLQSLSLSPFWHPRPLKNRKKKREKSEK